MLKALGRAVFITTILLLAGTAIWYHPIISVITIVVLWLAFMFFVDPPENWD